MKTTDWNVRLAGVPTAALPADLRWWLGEDRLLRLAIEHAAHRASTAPGPRGLYHAGQWFSSAQLLALLAFCYLTGRLSSIEIEDELETDEALRYLCAGRFPTSPLLRRFRRLHRAPLALALADVLGLAIRERASQAWPSASDLDPVVGREARPEAAQTLSHREADARLARAVLADTMALDV